jgi:hypothetical protein
MYLGEDVITVTGEGCRRRGKGPEKGAVQRDKTGKTSRLIQSGRSDDAYGAGANCLKLTRRVVRARHSSVCAARMTVLPVLERQLVTLGKAKSDHKAL